VDTRENTKEKNTDTRQPTIGQDMRFKAENRGRLWVVLERLVNPMRTAVKIPMEENNG
jgi:hypothetical protein